MGTGPGSGCSGRTLSFPDTFVERRGFVSSWMARCVLIADVVALALAAPALADMVQAKPTSLFGNSSPVCARSGPVRLGRHHDVIVSGPSRRSSSFTRPSHTSTSFNLLSNIPISRSIPIRASAVPMRASVQSPVPSPNRVRS